MMMWKYLQVRVLKKIYERSSYKKIETKIWPIYSLRSVTFSTTRVDSPSARFKCQYCPNSIWLINVIPFWSEVFLKYHITCYILYRLNRYFLKNILIRIYWEYTCQLTCHTWYPPTTFVVFHATLQSKKL